MPVPIPIVDRAKEQDDPWTTADANVGPITSERIAEAWRQEHNADGEHLLPAPEAVGLLVFDGGSSKYRWEWQHGFDPLVDPVRLNTGLVRLELLNIMRSADHVIAAHHPDDEGLVGSITADATTTTVTIQIVDDSYAPMDRTGLVVVWGERLTP